MSLRLTLLETIDDTAVHCQTEGVARLDWKLLRVLRPLPAVPVRTKEKLTQRHKQRTRGQKRLLLLPALLRLSRHVDRQFAFRCGG